MRIKNKYTDQIVTFIGKDSIDVFLHAKNYLSAGFITNAMGFFAIPFFTRMLNPDEYGIIAIYSSIFAIFTVFLGLDLHFFIEREYYEKRGDFNQTVGTIYVFLLCFNLALAPALYYLRDYINLFFRVDIPVLFLGIFTAFFYVQKNIYLLYLKAKKQSARFSAITILLSSLFLSLSIALVLYLKDNKFMGRVMGESIIAGIFGFYFIYNIIRIARFSPRLDILKKGLSFSLPLLPHTLSFFVLNQFDRIIINQLNGPTETGLYSFAYKVGSILYIFITSINTAWVPHFYEKMNERDITGINTVLKKNTTLLYFIAVSLILFSKEIVVILSDRQYHTALTSVPFIVIGYIFVHLSSSFSQYTSYRRKTFLISANTVIAGSVNIALNYLLIPKYGYIIAAVTTMVSYMVLAFSHYLTAKYVIRFREIIPLKLILSHIYYVFLAALLFYLTEFYVQGYFLSLLLRFVFFAVMGYMIWGKRLLAMKNNV